MLKALRFFLLALLFASPMSGQTTIGTFTGGDVGEGLDLDGLFLYAVNARGPAVGPIRDAVFTDDTAPGVTLVAANEILNWSTPNFGSSSNDDNLEIVMQSIRWMTYPGTVNVDLEGLQPGAHYRLQLLLGEDCCTRGFDVFVEGNLIADDFSPNVTQGGTPLTTTGAVITHDFVAGDHTLNIVLGGTDTVFSDDNPVLQGFTLEQTGGADIPALDPLALLAMVALLAGTAVIVLRRYS